MNIQIERERYSKGLNEMKHMSGPGIPSHIHIFLTNKEKVKKTCIMNFKKKDSQLNVSINCWKELYFQQQSLE